MNVAARTAATLNRRPVAPTTCHRFVGAFWVVVHTAEATTDAESERAWADLSANYASVKGTLVVTMGGGPNAFQRRRMREVLGNRRIPRTAVVTTSSVGRMLVAAINLFADQRLRLFAPHDLDGALSYLDVPVPTTRLLREQIAEFRKELGISDT